MQRKDMNANKALTGISLFIVLAIIYVSGNSVTGNESIVEESGSFTAFFCPEHNCTHEFIKAINGARSVKCAFYGVNIEPLTKSLKDANASIIIHSANHYGFGMQVQSPGLMHHKFCVINQTIVITGSYNPTTSEASNKNNILIIESSTIAKNYEMEFDALMEGKEKKSTKNTKVSLSGQLVKNYFCPQDHCQEKIMRELEAAEESIYFMTFTFTDKEIAGILASKHQAGLHVKGVIENFQRKDVWVKPLLDEAGISTKVISEKSLQHNKIFIIDNTTIITGSYNPTRAAYTINDENILIITSQGLAKEYADYFYKIYHSTT